MRPPLFTKPAGVFLQLLGLAVIVGAALLGLVMQNALSFVLIEVVIAGLLAGVVLLWLGRQTHPREDRPQPPSGDEFV